jgi:hypothetical protein
VKNYEAQFSVTPDVDDEDEINIVWAATYDAADGREDKDARASIDAIFKDGIGSIKGKIGDKAVDRCCLPRAALRASFREQSAFVSAKLCVGCGNGATSCPGGHFLPSDATPCGWAPRRQLPPFGPPGAQSSFQDERVDTRHGPARLPKNPSAQ